MAEFEAWLRHDVLRSDFSPTLRLAIEDDTNATISVERKQSGHVVNDVFAIHRETTGRGNSYILSSATAIECCHLAPQGDIRPQIYDGGLWVNDGPRCVSRESVACTVSATEDTGATTSSRAVLDASLSQTHDQFMRKVAAGLTKIFEGSTSLKEGVEFYQYGEIQPGRTMASVWEEARLASWVPSVKIRNKSLSTMRLYDVAQSARWVADFLQNTSIFFAGKKVKGRVSQRQRRSVHKLLKVLAKIDSASLIIAALGHVRLYFPFKKVRDTDWPTFEDTMVSSLSDLMTAIATECEQTGILPIDIQTVDPASYCIATHPRNAEELRCLCEKYKSIGPPAEDRDFTNSIRHRRIPCHKLLPPANRDGSKALESIIGKKASDRLSAAIQSRAKTSSAAGDQAANESADTPTEDMEMESNEVEARPGADTLSSTSSLGDCASTNRRYHHERDDRAGQVSFSPIAGNGRLDYAAPPFGSLHVGNGGGSANSAPASESGGVLDGRLAENTFYPPTGPSPGASPLSMLANIASQNCPHYGDGDSGYGSSQFSVSGMALPVPIHSREQAGSHSEFERPHNPLLQAVRAPRTPLPSEATPYRRQPSYSTASSLSTSIQHSSLQVPLMPVGAPTVSLEQTFRGTKRTRLPDSDSVRTKRQLPNTTDTTEAHSTNAGHEQDPGTQAPYPPAARFGDAAQNLTEEESQTVVGGITGYVANDIPVPNGSLFLDWENNPTASGGEDGQTFDLDSSLFLDWGNNPTASGREDGHAWNPDVNFTSGSGSV